MTPVRHTPTGRTGQMSTRYDRPGRLTAQVRFDDNRLWQQVDKSELAELAEPDSAPLAPEHVMVLRRADRVTAPVAPVAANAIHSATLTDLRTAGYLAEQWHTPTAGPAYLAAVITDAGRARLTDHDRHDGAALLARLRDLPTPPRPQPETYAQEVRHLAELNAEQADECDGGGFGPGDLVTVESLRHAHPGERYEIREIDATGEALLEPCDGTPGDALLVPLNVLAHT